tara:strand:+ start:2467 stop:2928 length:462 start_codon:yes stop_codon:yes gene_type:complete
VGLNRPEFSKRPGFRYLLAFERDGRQHTVPHMFALWIVEHFDVVEHVLAGLQAGFVGSTPYSLPLEQIEEALGCGAIMAVAASAASPNLSTGKSLSVSQKQTVTLPLGLAARSKSVFLLASQPVVGDASHGNEQTPNGGADRLPDESAHRPDT